MKTCLDLSCMPDTPLEGALRTAREAGFCAVTLSTLQIEAALSQSFNLVADIRGLLDRFGQQLALFEASTLEPAEGEEPAALIDLLRLEMDVARHLDQSAVIVTAGQRDAMGLAELQALLHAAAARADAAGMPLLLRNRYGSRIEQIEDLRWLLGNLPPATVRVAVDIGAFHAAAVNATHAFAEFAHRIDAVYLTDQKGRSPQPMGSGEVNIAAMLRAIKQINFHGWIAVGTVIDGAAEPADALDNARTVLDELHDETAGT
jgi:sugar phosphate isomerase/epimerase